MEFKDYKEKQKFYKERVKQEKILHLSIPAKNFNYTGKGVTYIKPKENENDNDR